MDREPRDDWNPLRSLFSFFGWAFASLLLVTLGAVVLLALNVEALGGAQFDDQAGQLLFTFATQTLAGFWRVAAPLIQLLIVLALVEWFLRRMGLNALSPGALRGFEWNTQAVVAVIVIGSFAVAALGGLTEGLGALKDLALVVVGFYFGTQRKVLEIDPATGQIKQVETHSNPAVAIVAKRGEVVGTPASPTEAQAPPARPDSSQPDEKPNQS